MANQWWESNLTIPGKLDVYGVSLLPNWIYAVPEPDRGIVVALREVPPHGALTRELGWVQFPGVDAGDRFGASTAVGDFNGDGTRQRPPRG